MPHLSRRDYYDFAVHRSGSLEAYEADPDAGRDIGEPTVDDRDFRAWLTDYVSDAEAVYRATPANERDTLSYRNGLYQAALEITARYLQEND